MADHHTWVVFTRRTGVAVTLAQQHALLTIPPTIATHMKYNNRQRQGGGSDIMSSTCPIKSFVQLKREKEKKKIATINKGHVATEAAREPMK